MNHNLPQVVCVRYSRAVLALGAVLVAVAACSPVLNWRQVRVDAQVQALFPCKPDQVERSVSLESGTTPARMWSCDAGEATWSVTQFDLPASDAATATLRQLRHKLLLHLKGSEELGEPANLKGMTPNEEARRSHIRGVRSDGSALVADAVWAARGARIYQVVVLSRPSGPAVSHEAVTEFLGGITLSD